MLAHCPVPRHVYELWKRHDNVTEAYPVLLGQHTDSAYRISAGSNTTDADRAPIRMTHDTQFLTISQEEANRIDEEAKRRLLAGRKLSLVVDLDQTIIHAAVDPTIKTWMDDPDNPNHDAVKDVRMFQLVDDGPGMRGCWYYIKLRPGLEQFLESISKLYELHIYTMGTRQYAQQIAKIIDPDSSIFGERILSRDESGSMVAKNLERLFPVDTKMVVIIDDRGDVWKWSANLLRVTPFEFFVGIGDINSSFLPKKEELPAPEINEPTSNNEQGSPTDDSAPTTNGIAEDGTSTVQHGTAALEQLVEMSGGDDPAIREIQSKDQEAVISSQLEDKPLLKMQMEQDEKDDAEAATVDTAANGETQPTIATESDSSDSSESSSSTVGPKSKGRHSILKNDDAELVYLESSLTNVHTAFFTEYDRKRMSNKGGRVAALSGKRKMPLPASEDGDDTLGAADLVMIPDVKKVMPAMKMRVLANVVIVFSGVLPLGTDVQSADISTWAKTFGAKIVEKVSRGVTHVIARRAGTAKVKQAVKRGIKVVSTSWLLESIQQWKRQDEKRYLLEGANGKSQESNGEETIDRISVTANDFLLSSSEGEDGETDGHDTETDEDGPVRKKLKVDTNASMPATGRLSNISEEDRNDAEETAVFDNVSPLTIDQDEWGDIDAELKEFLGSDAESGSDTDSVSSRLSIRARKRKRATGDDENDGSSLKAVAKPDPENDRIASAQKRQEEREEAQEAEEEDSDDELARELERELEEADAADEDAEEGFMG